MYVKLSLGDKPHDRVIIPQDLRETVTNGEKEIIYGKRC